MTKKLLFIIPFLVLGIIISLILMMVLAKPDEVEGYIPPKDTPKQNILEVHFVNMKRNDAIIIRTNEHVIVIDGGTYYQGDIITEYLKKLNITHIDYLIGSHLHFNHIPAHAKILKNFNVDKMIYAQDPRTCFELKYCDPEDTVYILEEINNRNKEITIWQARDEFEIGKMHIKVIGPLEEYILDGEYYYPQNINSLNFILTFGDVRFLFTGDGMQEENILKEFSEELKVDVFHFPHHGEDELGKKLIKLISPKYIIETNRTNELMNNNKNTGDLLIEAGAKIFYYEDNRSIIFKTDGTNLTYERR